MKTYLVYVRCTVKATDRIAAEVRVEDALRILPDDVSTFIFDSQQDTP